VFKEKYYPGFNFLGAKLGTRPSYAWSSVYGAKDLLEEGIIWQVGNGNDIMIWGDKWVHSQHKNKIQAPVSILDR
jgi:hypothetical protein